jgi:peptidyl-prolyl cis-trans isomerase A (cyclophilin A)
MKLWTFIVLMLPHLALFSDGSVDCEHIPVTNYSVALENPCGKQMNVKAPDNFDMIFGTNYGEFTANCRRDRAPVWMDRIYNLALNGYYNENYFFRVIDDFVVQFGTNGYPSVSNVYNWNSSNITRCSILQPQPDKMPINTNDIHGLSNLFGTISMSTSYNETTETTWNATAELFINLANNSRLDPMLFVPVCTIDVADMERVVLRFPSFGEVQELGGPGPSINELYAQGNAYIEANESWSTMAETSTVRVICPSSIEMKEMPTRRICGPCLPRSTANSATDSHASMSVPYQYFSEAESQWLCPGVRDIVLDTCSSDEGVW